MSAAEKFVAERNRDLRVRTAPKDSLEHQVTLEEVNIVRGAAEIDAAVEKMRVEGRLTDPAIAEERQKLVANWDGKSRRALDALAKRVEAFDDGFSPPELDQTKVLILAQQFQQLSGEERMNWIREARTGNTELALFFLHAPETLTNITKESRSSIAYQFRSEKDIIRAERKRDLVHRGRAALEAYESERRRLINAH